MAINYESRHNTSTYAAQRVMSFPLSYLTLFLSRLRQPTIVIFPFHFPWPKLFFSAPFWGGFMYYLYNTHFLAKGNTVFFSSCSLDRNTNLTS